MSPNPNGSNTTAQTTMDIEVQMQQMQPSADASLKTTNDTHVSTSSTMDWDESLASTTPTVATQPQLDSQKSTQPASTDQTLPSTPTTDTLDGTFRVDYSPRHSLGTGMHTWVRPAIHRTTGERYAVKSVRAFRRNEVALLQQEAALLRKVAPHPAIIQLHDTYQDQAAFHLVLELCQGGEVFDLVTHATEHCKLVDEAAAVRIVQQLVNAVAHCHDRHIVHRDLKLENVLFKHPANRSATGGWGHRHHDDDDDASTEIRLIDFGLAVVHNPDAPPLTEHVGSPYYVAPEVLRRSYDKACDIWSLGALTYALLCGEPPFDGGETDDRNIMFHNICHAPLEFTHAAWWDTTISPAARDFVTQCLQKDPQARPTAADLLQHEWLLQSNATVAAPKRRKRRGLLLGAFFNVVLLLALVSSFSATSHGVVAFGSPPVNNPRFVRHSMSPRETDSLLGTESSTQSNVSTGQRILDLAIPAAGALLIDPLLTLVDTALVGRTSGESPAPLAGMGSAAALLTFSFYAGNFLCTAVTPLVSAKRAAGDEEGAIQVGGQALSLAVVLGLLLTFILRTASQPLLYVMGTANTGDEANAYALSFLSVRALAAPAVLLMEASTGVLRGYLDTKTPIFVLVAANMVNLVLDVILIVGLGLGPMGAAIATTTAEWMSAGLYLAVLVGRLPAAGGELAKTDESREVVIRPLLELPTWEQIRPLLVASSSVLLRTLVLQLSLSGAAAMAARGGAAAPSVAAHQIGMQLYLLGSFFCDSLAAASQGLVADAIGRQDAPAVRDIASTIFRYSLYLGLALAALLQIGSSTGLLYDIFTRDPLTQASLSEILPLLVVAQPISSLVFAADGVLQGASEFPYQARAMVLSGLTGVGTFVALQVAGPSDETLLHVWGGLIALQVMRGLTSLYKIVEEDGPINLLSNKGAA